jgi:hypothetical protein
MRTIGLIFSCVCALSIHAQYSSLPISLSLPMDHDTIEESEPNFVWQANLSSLQSDPRLSMQLVVVKVSEDQTATEAIVENAPIFIRQGLVSNSLTYSNPGYSLEKGSWYAWQLSYLFNGLPIQQSEVWRFILSDPVVNQPVCIALRRAIDNNIYELKEDALLLSTDETTIQNLTAQLYDDENNKISFDLIPVEESNPSDMKKFKLDVDALDLKKGKYRFEWKANKQTYFTLYFKK